MSLEDSIVAITAKMLEENFNPSKPDIGTTFDDLMTASESNLTTFERFRSSLEMFTSLLARDKYVQKWSWGYRPEESGFDTMMQSLTQAAVPAAQGTQPLSQSPILEIGSGRGLWGELWRRYCDKVSPQKPLVCDAACRDAGVGDPAACLRSWVGTQSCLSANLGLGTQAACLRSWVGTQAACLRSWVGTRSWICTDPFDYEWTFTKVEKLEAREAVLKYPECTTLVICWPLFDQPYAYEALKVFSGDIVIYCGETKGCTADDNFHELLEAEWVPTTNVTQKHWPGMADSTWIYRRKSQP